MAMNPMQRKIRNSFLFGFLVALLIGAVVAGLLIMKNKKTQEELAKAQEQNKIALKEVYVTAKNIGKGESMEMVTASLPAQYVPENAITNENIGDYYVSNGDDEDSEETLEMISLLDINENTMITTDMVEKSAEAATYRMVEYSMISLPSMLQEGDYIDIRLACLGYDCVVLSKIKVQSCNTTTIWLKLSESQLQTLNYAIVESYIMGGTKLYATQYTDVAQTPLNTTYVPDDNTIAMIQNNISKDGTEWEELYEPNGSVKNESALRFRTDIIGSLRNEAYSEEDIDAITEGYTTEKSSIQAARDALMGDIGY